MDKYFDLIGECREVATEESKVTEVLDVGKTTKSNIQEAYGLFLRTSKKDIGPMFGMRADAILARAFDEERDALEYADEEGLAGWVTKILPGVKYERATPEDFEKSKKIRELEAAERELEEPTTESKTLTEEVVKEKVSESFTEWSLERLYSEQRSVKTGLDRISRAEDVSEGGVNWLKDRLNKINQAIRDKTTPSKNEGIRKSELEKGDKGESDPKRKGKIYKIEPEKPKPQKTKENSSIETDSEKRYQNLVEECRQVAKGKVEEKKVDEQDEEPSKEEPTDIPPPPEEVKEPETEKLEARKEYLGKSEDTHYYFVVTEGEADKPEDLLIVDQEGVKKYSARDHNMEVSEEGIADFIIKAIQDVKIDQIERSIFMKYILPKLEEEAPRKEEVVEEPKEKEKPKEVKPEEEKPEKEEPTKIPPEKQVESKKVSETFLDNKTVEYIRKVKKDIANEVSLDLLGKSFDELSDEDKGRVEKQVESAVENILLGEGKNPKQGDKEKEQIKKLSEMKVTDDEGNIFDVHLVDDGTTDTVIDISGREFRFDPEFAAYWRDEEGTLTDEGLRELALDALANIEPEEYNELVMKAKSEEKEETKGFRKKYVKAVASAEEEPEFVPPGEEEVKEATFDYIHKAPGIYKVTFYDSHTEELEGESKVDAKAKAEKIYPESKVSHVEMLQATEKEEDIRIQSNENKLDQLVARHDELKAKEDAGTITSDMKLELLDLEKRIKELRGAVESKVSEQKDIWIESPEDVTEGTFVYHRADGSKWEIIDIIGSPEEEISGKATYVVGKVDNGVQSEVSFEELKGNFELQESKNDNDKKRGINMAEKSDQNKKQTTLESIKADVVNWVNNVAGKKDLVDLWSKLSEAEVKTGQIEGNKVKEDSVNEVEDKPSEGFTLVITYPSEKYFEDKNYDEKIEDIVGKEADGSGVGLRDGGRDLEFDFESRDEAKKASDKVKAKIPKVKTKIYKMEESTSIDEAKPEGEDAEAVAKKSATHHAKQDKTFTAKVDQTKQLGEPKEDADKIAKQSASHHAKQDKAHSFSDPQLKQIKAENESVEEANIEEKLFTKQFKDLAVGADFMYDGKRCVKYSETEYKSKDKVSKISPETEVEAIEKPRRGNPCENKTSEATEGQQVDVYTSVDDKTPQKATIVSYKRPGEDGETTAKLASGKTVKMTFDDRSNKWIIREGIEIDAPEPEEDEELDILNDEVQDLIDEMIDSEDNLDEAKKKKLVGKKGRPLKKGAAVRARGDCVFPHTSPKVTDNKDHFPINSENQARNALARANQYKSAPKWYKGSLESLVKTVARKVKSKYPDIKVTKAAETPGKGPKESLIPVEDEQIDITERKGLERLNQLLGLNG